MLNAYDEFASEQALDQGQRGTGSVTVVTVGPKEAQKELRDTLARGATRPAAAHHKWPTTATASRRRSRVDQDGAVHLVLCGRRPRRRQHHAVRLARYRFGLHPEVGKLTLADGVSPPDTNRGRARGDDCKAPR